MTLRYLHGFGNEHESEAEPGALPQGQFSPQHPPLGLYPEQFSGTAFTAPRQHNRRTWLYRIRPSVVHGAYAPYPGPPTATAPCLEPRIPAVPLRWDPPEIGNARALDFVDSLTTYATNGDQPLGKGIGVHRYDCGQAMHSRFFSCNDGELLIVPQHGGLDLDTECGALRVTPGEIAVVPRAMKFAASPIDGLARGYVCENYGSPLTLPERGPVGANGFANERDFRYPSAAYVDASGEFELIAKFDGGWYQCHTTSHPLDVVAWVGNCAPYVYDLARFNAMNSVTFDHPDPSIFTVLTSPADQPGVANLDFVIFPPRWAVAEHTFRPPWFHRNRMSEFMGMVYGRYEGKSSGFEPGGASLHNAFVPHGPDRETLDKATDVELEPTKIDAGLAFMFETCYPLRPTEQALTSPSRQPDYANLWRDIPQRFDTGD